MPGAINEYFNRLEIFSKRNDCNLEINQKFIQNISLLFPKMYNPEKLAKWIWSKNIRFSTEWINKPNAVAEFKKFVYISGTNDIEKYNGLNSEQVMEKIIYSHSTRFPDPDEAFDSIEDSFNTNINSFFNLFEEIRSLGRGAFGKVFHVRHKKSGKELAVKVIPLVDVHSYSNAANLYESSEDSYVTFEEPSQVKISNVLNCQHVVDNLPELLSLSPIEKEDEDVYTKFYELSKPPFREIEFNTTLSYFYCENLVSHHRDWIDIFGNEVNLYITMELCQFTLNKCINDNTVVYTYDKCISIISDLTNGLEYMHMKNIFHEDLHNENILFGFDGKWKIADFGCSKYSQFKSFDPRQRTLKTQSKVRHQLNDEQMDDMQSLGLIYIDLLKCIIDDVDIKLKLDKLHHKYIELPKPCFPHDAKIIFNLLNKKLNSSQLMQIIESELTPCSKGTKVCKFCS